MARIDGSISSTNTNAQYFSFYLEWDSSQNQAGNYSTVHVRTYYYTSTTNAKFDTVSATSHSITCDGTTRTISKQIDCNPWPSNPYLIQEEWFTVYHNADGNKSFTLSAASTAVAGIYGPGNCSASGWITLPKINRKADLKSAPNFNDEENPTITYSNPAGNSVSTLQAAILVDSAETIKYRDVNKTGSSYTFEFTEEERNALRNACSTSNTKSAVFRLKTTLSNSTFTSDITKTLTIKDGDLVINPQAYVERDSTTHQLTGSQTEFIYGLSDVLVTMGASARKGAWITSQVIKNGEDVIEDSSGMFLGVTNGDFVFTATDSRGNTKTVTLTRTVHKYTVITVNPEPQVFVDGTGKIRIYGNYLNGSLGSTSNTLSVAYRYKVRDGEWGDWVEISGATMTEEGYDVTATFSGLDYREQYVFQARASDTVKTTVSREIIVVALPIFEWCKHDFKFNVPVIFAGGLKESTTEADFSLSGDYVVDQGAKASGDIYWYYRKWNSGAAECWGSLEISTPVATQWGGLYVSGSLGPRTNKTFPFSFTEEPTVNVTLSANQEGAFLIASGSGYNVTTDQTGGYEIARGSVLSSSGSFRINYDIKGRWK